MEANLSNVLSIAVTDLIMDQRISISKERIGCYVSVDDNYVDVITPITGDNSDHFVIKISPLNFSSIIMFLLKPMGVAQEIIGKAVLPLDQFQDAETNFKILTVEVLGSRGLTSSICVQYKVDHAYRSPLLSPIFQDNSESIERRFGEDWSNYNADLTNAQAEIQALKTSLSYVTARADQAEEKLQSIQQTPVENYAEIIAQLQEHVADLQANPQCNHTPLIAELREKLNLERENRKQLIDKNTTYTTNCQKSLDSYKAKETRLLARIEELTSRNADLEENLFSLSENEILLQSQIEELQVQIQGINRPRVNQINPEAVSLVPIEPSLLRQPTNVDIPQDERAISKLMKYIDENNLKGSVRKSKNKADTFTFGSQEFTVSLQRGELMAQVNGEILPLAEFLRVTDDIQPTISPQSPSQLKVTRKTPTLIPTPNKNTLSAKKS